jgi:hypothetical protein
MMVKKSDRYPPVALLVTRPGRRIVCLAEGFNFLIAFVDDPMILALGFFGGFGCGL